MKKLTSSLTVLLLFGLFVLPMNVLAQSATDCEDQDGDRYCSGTDCDPLPIFCKGVELERCDEPVIDSNTYGYEMILHPDIESIEGNKVHPGVPEAPNSKVDYNCDGKIADYVPGDHEGNSDLFGMIEKVITLIGQVAVFISAGAFIYGGIMFATAAGEEGKIRKAKKTLIGAAVGLVCGLIAWNIVGFIADTFG